LLSPIHSHADTPLPAAAGFATFSQAITPQKAAATAAAATYATDYDTAPLLLRLRFSIRCIPRLTLHAAAVYAIIDIAVALPLLLAITPHTHTLVAIERRLFI